MDGSHAEYKEYIKSMLREITDMDEGHTLADDEQHTEIGKSILRRVSEDWSSQDAEELIAALGSPGMTPSHRVTLLALAEQIEQDVKDHEPATQEKLAELGGLVLKMLQPNMVSWVADEVIRSIRENHFDQVHSIGDVFHLYAEGDEEIVDRLKGGEA